jgi:hypothetical protein
MCIVGVVVNLNGCVTLNVVGFVWVTGWYHGVGEIGGCWEVYFNSVRNDRKMIIGKNDNKPHIL